jgi:hypothetical protein
MGYQNEAGGTGITPGGSGGNPSVNPPASWLVSDWYVDPVNGNENNAGTTSGAPVKTIEGGIVPKWQTPSPILPQNTMIHLLNPETLGQENAVISPVMVGGSWLAIVGTKAQVATFNLGTVTPKNRNTPELLASTGFTASGLAAGQLVVNTSRNNSEAWIQSISVGTAALTQPLMSMTAATGAQIVPAVPNEVDTWATGDTVIVYTVPLLNLKGWSPSGGDCLASGLGGASWLQYVKIPVAANLPGFAYWALNGGDCVPYMISCAVDGYLQVTGVLGGGVGGGLVSNCYLDGGASVYEATVFGGLIGSSGVGFGLDLEGGGATVDGDAICYDLDCPRGGTNYVGNAYVTNSILLLGDSVLKIDGIWGIGAIVWGPGSCAVQDYAALMNIQGGGGSWSTVLLLTGALTLRGQTTGTKYSGTSWVNGVAITTASLNSAGTIQDTTMFGCRYAGLPSS